MTGLRELSGGASRGALAALLVLALSVTALAEDGATGEGAAEGVRAATEAPADFRGKVTLGYGMVVGAIVIYVLISARRNARLTEEIEFLEQRVGELEK